jgi:hypothetical protein
MISIGLMFLGGILLLSGVWMYAGVSKKAKGASSENEMKRHIELAAADGVLTPREAEHLRDMALERNLDVEEVIAEAHHIISKSDKESETEIIDHIKKSGDDFEKYVVGKFNKKHFHLTEWAGDKYSEGRYAKSTLNPDLILELDLGRKDKFPLAVECKYRSRDQNGRLKVCSEEQLKRYTAYQNESGTPTFIVLGLGGTPSDPDRLFAVPIRALKYAKASLDYLSTFEVDKKRNFFFDFKTKSLSTGF